MLDDVCHTFPHPRIKWDPLTLFTVAFDISKVNPSTCLLSKTRRTQNVWTSIIPETLLSAAVPPKESRDSRRGWGVGRMRVRAGKISSKCLSVLLWEFNISGFSLLHSLPPFQHVGTFDSNMALWFFETESISVVWGNQTSKRQPETRDHVWRTFLCFTCPGWRLCT